MSWNSATAALILCATPFVLLLSWPVAGLDCRLINCDCARVSAGLLTKEYQRQCRVTESSVRASCETGKAAEFCHATASGPDAFPMRGGSARPPAASRVDQVVGEFQLLSPRDRIRRFRERYPELQALGEYEPELALGAAVGGVTTAGYEAWFAATDGLGALTPSGTGAVPPAAARQAAVALIKAPAALDRGGPENPAGLYRLAKTVERLGAAGVGLTDLAGGDADTMKTLEKAAKWAKAGLDMRELAERGDIEARQFVGDMLGLVPKSASPVLDGPAGRFFRDLMSWNDKMWRSTTDGLDLVTGAIESGRLDRQAYARVSDELQGLAKDGPWNLQSGLDFVKKSAEELPLVGKLLKALWGG